MLGEEPIRGGISYSVTTYRLGALFMSEYDANKHLVGGLIVQPKPLLNESKPLDLTDKPDSKGNPEKPETWSIDYEY